MGLMDFYFNNIQRAAQARAAGQMQARADLMAEYAPQAQAIMGQGPTLQPGQYGSGQMESLAPATGLMAADPNDPMAFIQAGMGLMQLPGYQGAANTFLSQAVSNQLGRGYQAAQLAEQQRYHDAQLNMQGIKLQNDLAQRVGPYSDMSQYMTAAGGLRDDARAELQPYRQAVSLLDTTRQMVNDKGFHGLSTTDDTALIKAYAKLLLPNEAVMTDDVEQIASSDKIESVFRGFASRINAKMALSPAERAQLVDAIDRLGQDKLQEYGQLRRDYEQRALRSMVNPADVLNTALTVGARNYEESMQKMLGGGPGAGTVKPGTVTDPALNEYLTNKAADENREWYDPTTWRTPWGTD